MVSVFEELKHHMDTLSGRNGLLCLKLALSGFIRIFKWITE